MKANRIKLGGTLLLIGLSALGVFLHYASDERRGSVFRVFTTDSALKQREPISDPAAAAGANERLWKDMYAPITFYGKVVDQHGDSVSGANVLFYVNNTLDERTAKIPMQTDAAGRFALIGAHGFTLGVEVSKVGYRSISAPDGKSGASRLFDFGVASDKPFQSSNEKPAILSLYKKGPIEPLVNLRKRSYVLPRNGAPIGLSLDKAGGHKVIFRCWNEDQKRAAGQKQYRWRLEINVESGGILLRNDALNFIAPKEGYTPKALIEMDESLPPAEWRNVADRSYFIRFADGTAVLAKLSMKAFGDNIAVWESYFNPRAGSDNLEY